jgi:hypothetical protein
MKMYKFQPGDYDRYRRLLASAQAERNRAVAVAAARLLLVQLRHQFQNLPSLKRQSVKSCLLAEETLA